MGIYQQKETEIIINPPVQTPLTSLRISKRKGGVKLKS